MVLLQPLFPFRIAFEILFFCIVQFFDGQVQVKKKTPDDYKPTGELLKWDFVFCYLNSTGSKNFTGTALPRCLPGVQSSNWLAIA